MSVLCSYGDIAPCHSGFRTNTHAATATLTNRGKGTLRMYLLGIFPTHPRRALGAAALGKSLGEFRSCR